MDKMRDAAGAGADLQILTRSVSGVTLTTQRLKALEMQARLMKKHGTTIDRNFDFMNDTDNLIKTGKPIVDAGMHHQVCVALMGLPYKSEQVHTPDFYVRVIQKLLDAGLHFDSVCMKDSSGTTDPRTCYETAKGLKKILPPEVPLAMHTHDTASMAVACYMAGIAGGVDRIDLSVRPLASGTSQPDVRSMWHALKGTGYSLDIDAGKMDELEKTLDEGLKEYSFNPVTTSADARVVNFPMPGGAIGPNVQMMAEARILHRYGEVLAEFPEVVRAGGAWTSVTPGSQQYWLQAFNNVLHGRWKKIDPGYGRSVLGYFGRTPEPPDPEVIKIAGEQLKLEPFAGDPLEKAPDSIALAEDALRERNLPLTEEKIFLVGAARRHRARQEHGTERRHPVADRQGQGQPAAQGEGSSRRAPAISLGSNFARSGSDGRAGRRFHRAGDHPMHGGRRQRHPHLPGHHRTTRRRRAGLGFAPAFHSRARACRNRPAHAGLFTVRGQGRAGGNQRQGRRRGAKGASGRGGRSDESQTRRARALRRPGGGNQRRSRFRGLRRQAYPDPRRMTWTPCWN